MVKGISKQVIVVRPREPKLFEQAIFILREDAQPDTTEEALLKEAQIAASYPREDRQQKWQCAVCGAIGAGITALAWMLSML